MSRIVSGILHPEKENPDLNPFSGTSHGTAILRAISKKLDEGGDRDVLINAGAALQGLPHDGVCPTVLRLSSIVPQSRAAARALHQTLGIRPHDVVQISLPNCASYFLPVFATWLNRATVSFSDPDLSVALMKVQLEMTGAKVIVCTGDNLKRVLAARGDRATAVAVMGDFDAGDEDNNVLSYDALAAGGGGLRDEDGPFPDEGFDPQDRVQIAWSSGTTGRPKGIQHNATLLQHGFNIEGAIPGDWLTGTCFYHRSGIAVLQRILQGEKTLFLRTTDLEGSGFNKMLAACSMFKPVVVMGGPHHILKLSMLTRAEVSPCLDLTSVLGAAAVGGGVPVDAADKIRDNVFPELLMIANGYGLSESGSFITFSFEANCLGPVMSPNRVKIVRPGCPDEEPMGPNQVGEIMAKDPRVMMGYLNDEEKTKEFFGKDGFYHTGDYGHYDSEGLMYYDGRLKDLIKVKDRHLYPVELEQIIIKMEGVQDVSIFGTPDPDFKELVRAAVVLKEGVTVSEEDIVRAVNEAIGEEDHKRLRGGVLFVDQLPRGATGKVQKRRLQELVEKRRARGH